MQYLRFEPGASRWKAQMNPLSYGSQAVRNIKLEVGNAHLSSKKVN